ncbi:MAG TPA: UTP--glucose-1-phosphate uridylyltransferase [Candidatus Limnocylindrales bacterium]|nr:UTP--glucose-1-phosphate uridylyltransferase [Candidatus Limnocylindrales bacterium]
MTLSPVRVAVIPAAGLGTRFLPVTKTIPKEMLPIVDRPAIQLVIEEVVAAGVEEVIVVSAPSKDPLDRFFGSAPSLEQRLEKEGRTKELALVRASQTIAKVTVIHQTEAKGNGDAVLCAREHVGERPFVMIWGDDITSATVPVARQLAEARERQGGGSVAAVMRVPAAEISRYGMIDGEPVADRTWRVRRLVEKPRPNEVSSDIAQVHGYVLEPSIFECLAAMGPGRGGEVWLADAVNALAQREPVWAYEFEGERFDTGDRLGYVQAVIAAALERPELGDLETWLRTRLARVDEKR